MNDLFSQLVPDPATLVLQLAALIPAFVFHEWAHAQVAYAMGDPTPRWTGRLTLNPLRHLDWLGLLMLLILKFGWAKPVQVNPTYFRNPRLGMFLVSFAGPGANLVLALAGLIVLKTVDPTGVWEAFWRVLVLYNVGLAAFNLLPVPPLDGSKMLFSVLPRPLDNLAEAAEQYGFVILLLLLATGVLSRWMFPFMQFWFAVLDPIASSVALLLPR